MLWKAGEHSLIDDVRFLGGHGSGTNPYNNNHTADSDLRKRWDSQYPSLWIADGGGGTFADIWTPNTFAQAGFMVSNTTTPGHVYELSNEHHVRNEIKFDHADNWDINAPQTEEEAGESPESLSLEIDFWRNITIANYHGYRVTRSRAPFPAAVRLYQSSDIHFRNVHVNAESGYGICDENGCGTFLRLSKFPYENAIEDVTHHLEVREREFAVLDIPADRSSRAKLMHPLCCAGRDVREAGRRLLLHLRRCGRCRRQALFRRSSQPAHLRVVGEGGADDRTRQSARSSQSRFRQVGQPAGAFLCGAGKHGLHVQAGHAPRKSYRAEPQPAQPHGGAAVILPGELVEQRRVQGPA